MSTHNIGFYEEMTKLSFNIIKYTISNSKDLDQAAV